MALEKVGKEFPNTHFTIIDSVVKLPNVQSVVFKEQEGSFLVGMLAALASKSGKVGFVGGMDIPLVRKLPVRLRAGRQVRQSQCRADPEHDRHDARGVERSGPRRASSPRASSTAASTWSMRRPATPASASCRRRRTAASSAIGVDSNQNYLHPGTMLTSMLKRVDVAAYNSFKAMQGGTWKGDVPVLGLKEGGVDWALDQYNEKLVTPEMKAKVDAAKADIISGKITVVDYMSNNTCK